MENSECTHNLHITGNTLVLDAIRQNKAPLVAKDLSWLWRTAYNSAVSGLGVWDDEDVTEMFVVARSVSSYPSPRRQIICSMQLMEASSKCSPIEVESDLHENWLMASFAAITGQGNAIPSLR